MCKNYCVDKNWYHYIYKNKKDLYKEYMDF